MDDRINISRLIDAGTLAGSGLRSPAEGPARFLGRVYDGGSMPTTNDHYYLVHPVEVDGTPCEGCTGTATADTSASIPVVVIGSKVPAVGDHLICYRVGGRWVAEAGGGTTSIACPNCPACGGSLILFGTLTDSNGNRWTVTNGAGSGDFVGLAGLGSVTSPSIVDGPDGTGSYSYVASPPFRANYRLTVRCAPDGKIGIDCRMTASLTGPGVPDGGGPVICGYNANHAVLGTSDPLGGTLAGPAATPTCSPASLSATVTYPSTFACGGTAPVDSPLTWATATLTLATPDTHLCCSPVAIPKATLHWSDDSNTYDMTFIDAPEGPIWLTDCIGTAPHSRHYVRCVAGTFQAGTVTYNGGGSAADCASRVGPAYAVTLIASWTQYPFNVLLDDGVTAIDG